MKLSDRQRYFLWILSAMRHDEAADGIHIPSQSATPMLRQKAIATADECGHGDPRYKLTVAGRNYLVSYRKRIRFNRRKYMEVADARHRAELEAARLREEAWAAVDASEHDGLLSDEYWDCLYARTGTK